MKKTDLTHLPSPPLSTPIISTSTSTINNNNNIQNNNKPLTRSNFPFPTNLNNLITSSNLIPSSSSSISPPSSDDIDNTTSSNNNNSSSNLNFKFNQNLLSTLPSSSSTSSSKFQLFNPKPLNHSNRLLSSKTPTSSSSSTSSNLNETPTPTSATTNKKNNIKKGVEFCTTPLASLNAIPKHKFQFNLNHLQLQESKKKRKLMFGSINSNSNPNQSNFENNNNRRKKSNFIYSNRINLLENDNDDDDDSDDEGQEEEGGIGMNGGLGSSPAARGHSNHLTEFDFNITSTSTTTGLRKDKLESLSSSSSMELDFETSDSEEEEIVEALLLSQSQLSFSSSSTSSSPPIRLTPFSLSLPDLNQFNLPPKSILKKSNYKIQVVKNAIEGAKRNGGRVKHMVGFGEVELTASGRKILVPLTAGSNSNHLSVKSITTTTTTGGGEGEGKETSKGFDTFGSTTPINEVGKDKENGKGKSREEGNGSSSNNRDNRKDDDESGGNGNGNGGGGGNGKIVYNIKDDDPILLRTPLLILKASLQPITTNYIRQPNEDSKEDNQMEGVLPRPSIDSNSISTSPLNSYMKNTATTSPTSPPKLPIATSMLDSNTTSNSNNTLLPNPIPILLNEVESAYVNLTRVLIRLPPHLNNVNLTLQPLIQFKSSLIKCLHRDINNLLISPPSTTTNSHSTLPISSRTNIKFPITSLSSTIIKDRQFPNLGSGVGIGSSSPAVGNSSPLSNLNFEGKPNNSRLGLSDSEMRRSKDEVGAAQAAIKCIGAIMQHGRLFEIFTSAELSSLLTIIIKIPTSPNVPLVIQKDVYPFIPWLISIQRLPTSLISSHLSKIISVLQITLITPDKARQNLSESISAIGRLISLFPEIVLSKWKYWFSLVVEGLFEVVKKGMGVRCRSCNTLGKVVIGLMTKWNGNGEKERRLKVANEISEEFLRILHAPRGGQETSLSVLKTELSKCLVDEAPTAVSIIGIIPALLGKRFRKLESSGIRPWIDLVNSCRDHSSIHIRNYSSLLWHHFISAFLRTPDVFNLIFDKARPRPMNLLTQLLIQRNIWENSSKLHLERGIILAQVLVGLFFGLTTIVRTVSIPTNTTATTSSSSPPPPPSGKIPLRKIISSSSSPPNSNLNTLNSTPSSSILLQQFNYYDQIWMTLVEPSNKIDPKTGIATNPNAKGDLINVINSVNLPVSLIGWKILIAILSPEDTTTTTTGGKVIIDRESNLDKLLNVVLLEANLGRSKSLVEQSSMVLKVSHQVVQPEAIPSWNKQWIIENSSEILILFDQILKIDMTKERMKFNLIQIGLVWKNFMLAFISDLPKEEIDANLIVIIEWVKKLDTIDLKPIQSLLITITFEVLGNLLTEFTVHGKAPCYNLVESFFSTPRDSLNVELSTRLLEVLVTLHEGSELVSTATLQAIKSAQNHEIYTQLATCWIDILNRPELKMNENFVDLIVELLRVSTRSKSSIEIFKELARSLSVAIFDQRDSTFSNYFDSIIEPPSDPVEDIKLITLIFSSVGNESRTLQEEILQPALKVLAVLLLTPDLVQIATLLTEMFSYCPDCILPTLYTKVLEGLTPILSQATKEDFEALASLLEHSLERTFNLQVIAIENSADSNSGVTSGQCLDTMKAFHQFWINTFQSISSNLNISSSFLNLFHVVKKVSIGLEIPGLESSQSQSSHETQLPPAAQAIAPPSPAESTPTNEPSGRGYEGDISTLTHGDVYNNSSTGLPSPILEVPQLKTNIMEVEQEEVEDVPESIELGNEPAPEVVSIPTSTIIEETPPEVQLTRSTRSSMVQVVDPLVVAAVAVVPKVIKRKRSRGSSASSVLEPEDTTTTWNITKETEIVIDSDSDDAVISTRRRPQTVEVPPAKKVKKTYGSNSRKRSTSEVVVEIVEKKRKKSNDNESVEASTSSSSQTKKVSKASKRKSSTKTSPSSSVPSEAEAEVEVETEVETEILPEPTSSQSQPSPNTRTQIITNFLSLSIEGVVRNAAELGGSQGLNRLIELGKQAKEFFAKSPGGSSRNSNASQKEEEEEE